MDGEHKQAIEEIDFSLKAIVMNCESLRREAIRLGEDHLFGVAISLQGSARQIEERCAAIRNSVDALLCDLAELPE